MAITKETLGELLKDYQKPEDLLSQIGRNNHYAGLTFFLDFQSIFIWAFIFRNPN
jgi:hypothetical protein